MKRESGSRSDIIESWLKYLGWRHLKVVSMKVISNENEMSAEERRNEISMKSS
jgi:hypothetical protein